MSDFEFTQIKAKIEKQIKGFNNVNLWSREIEIIMNKIDLLERKLEMCSEQRNFFLAQTDRNFQEYLDKSNKELDDLK